MVEHGCLLPLFPALGNMTPNELGLEQNTGFVSLSITPEWKCLCSKAGVVGIYSDHAIACHGWLDAIARHDAIRDKIVSTWSSPNHSPIVKKITSLKKVNHAPVTTLSRLGRRGYQLHLTYLLLRCCNPTLSLMWLQRQDTQLTRRMNKNIASTTITAQKKE